jgi:hypothetical protein
MKAYLVAAALSAVASAAHADGVTADKAFGIPVPKVPLTVRSSPPGATIKAVYGMGEDTKTIECVAPCTLKIPKMRAISITAILDGYTPASAPTVEWKNKVISGFVLEPNDVTIQLHHAAPFTDPASDKLN